MVSIEENLARVKEGVAAFESTQQDMDNEATMSHHARILRDHESAIRAHEAKMRELGKDIEVIWFDAGHGSGDREQVIGWYDRMLAFAKHRTNETKSE